LRGARHHADNTWTGLYDPQFPTISRDKDQLSILLLYLLLMFAGVNVPLDRLPQRMSTLAETLPVTHGAKAARELVAGTPLGHVAPPLAAEALVGPAYVLAGPTAIRLFELQARRGATLEVA
jgi:ABC-2 type transport system permease protein